MTDIDSIIIASLTGEASEEELRRLRRWRSEDLRHEREYRARLDAWALLGAFATSGSHRQRPSAELLSRVADAGDAGASHLDHGRAREVVVAVSPPRVRWLRVGLAASLILGLGAASVLWSRIESLPLGPATLVTGANEVATVTLADGTVVRLAPESRIEFFRGNAERQVWLTGRAYLAVSHMDGRPFQVHVPSGTVEVLGTRFEVRNGDGATRVAVVEGEVRMAAAGGNVQVGANEVARLTDQGQLDVERVEHVFQVIDWLGPFLAFESTPLRQVAQEFRERFGVEIEIVDDVLSDRTVTGWFSDLSVEEMIAGICAVVEAQCAIRDGTVRMEPRSSPAAGDATRATFERAP